MKKIILLCLSLLVSAISMATIKKVGPGGNLAATLKKSTGTDTIMVASGSYRLDGTLPVTRNIVIIGEEGEKPKISISAFFIRTGAERLVLENLDLTINRKYLVSSESDIDIDIDLISLRNCSIDFDGAEGACLVNAGSANTKKNRIGEIRIDDCLIFNSGFPLHVILNAGSTNQTKIGMIAVSNSTVANTARGLIATNVEFSGEVLIENCTFYELNTTDNNAGTIRMGQANVKLDIINSIFTFAGEKSRFIIVGQGSQINVADSYMTNEIPKISGAYGLMTLDGKASQVFQSPGADPTQPDVSFRMKPSFADGKQVGDPRWYK